MGLPLGEWGEVRGLGGRSSPGWIDTPLAPAGRSTGPSRRPAGPARPSGGGRLKLSDANVLGRGRQEVRRAKVSRGRGVYGAGRQRGDRAWKRQDWGCARAQEVREDGGEPDRGGRWGWGR